MARLQTCSRCRKSYPTSTWTGLNGFATSCPYCGVWNGRSWNVRAVALASFFLNCLSFLFTMPPVPALVSIAAFALGVYLTGPLATSGRHPNLEVAWYITVLCAPMLINAVLLVRHQMRLGQPARHR